MRVLLLGTGSADGWPSPFCDCASCAHQRAAGIVRGPSSALVDGTLLIDPGPGVPTAAARAATDLRGVRDVLVTHGHPDHCAPSLLLWRQWVPSPGPLDVWAPPSALALFRDWIGPRDEVALHPIAPGDRLALTGHDVDVLPAAHAHGDGDGLAAEAVLFRVTDRTGTALLYATDTGPLPEATIAALAGAPLAIALVDATFGPKSDHGTGHLDFTTLPAAVAALRSAGAVTDATRLVATHLSHHNPPEPSLAAELARLGMRAGRDGERLDTRRGSVTLVTGGARSGKSTYAESLARAREAGGARVRYVATAPAYPDDADWQARIAEHRTRRPATWEQRETGAVAEAIASADAGTIVLVDCLGGWVTRLMDEGSLWDAPPAEARRAVAEAADGLVEALASAPADVVIVTNEVGSGIVPATPSGRAFRDLLGTLNARVAREAGTTVLMVAGRPLIAGRHA